MFQEANEQVGTDLTVDEQDRVAIDEAIEQLEEQEGSPALGTGSVGQMVARWQRQLNASLAASDPEHARIDVDGIFGPYLQEGERAALVADWQSRLNDWLQLTDADVEALDVDGIFGPETEQATGRFQDANDRLETGLQVDPQDWTAIRQHMIA